MRAARRTLLTSSATPMSHWTSNTVSSAYAAFRPQYPPELFEAIAARCGGSGSGESTKKKLCVDVGCGNGQAVAGLVRHFEHVIGVDPSPSQVAHAKPFPNATYLCAPAERFTSVLPPHALHSVDCVTVAQAMHWFDMPAFMAQLDLALPAKGTDGLVVFWNYPLCDVVSHQGVDTLVKTLDAFLMSNGYWPQERKHVDNNYRDLLPFFDSSAWSIEHSSFPVEKTVSLDSFVKYLSTWSGVQKFSAAQQQQQQQQEGHRDLLAEFKRDALKEFNNADAESERTMRVVFRMETFFAKRKQQPPRATSKI